MKAQEVLMKGRWGGFSAVRKISPEPSQAPPSCLPSHKGFPYVPPPPAFVARFEFLLRDACVLESVQVHLPLLEVPVCLRHHVPARRLHHHVSSVSDD